MTADVHQEAEPRHRVVDYLVTNIGCDSEEIDLDLALNDLGVGCPDAPKIIGGGAFGQLSSRVTTQGVLGGQQVGATGTGTCG
jgi:hypothetical protein